MKNQIVLLLRCSEQCFLIQSQQECLECLSRLPLCHISASLTSCTVKLFWTMPQPPSSSSSSFVFFFNVFFLWVPFSILHTLHMVRRVLLSSAPPWPVKRTSAWNVMRSIHLEKKPGMRREEDKWSCETPCLSYTGLSDTSTVPLSPSLPVPQKKYDSCVLFGEVFRGLVLSGCASGLFQIQDSQWRT